MELTGPDDRVVADLAPDRPTLSVARDGTTVLDHSYLPVSKLMTELHGVSWHDGGDVSLTDPEPVAETYEMVRGKASEREHRAVATTATFTHPDAAGDVNVDLRVATDGVAVRYRVTGEGRDLTTGDALGTRDRLQSVLVDALDARARIAVGDHLLDRLLGDRCVEFDGRERVTECLGGAGGDRSGRWVGLDGCGERVTVERQ